MVNIINVQGELRRCPRGFAMGFPRHYHIRTPESVRFLFHQITNIKLKEEGGVLTSRSPDSSSSD